MCTMASVDPVVPNCSLSDGRENLLSPSSTTSMSVDGSHMLQSLGLLSTPSTPLLSSIPTTNSNPTMVKEDNSCDFSVESTALSSSTAASPQPQQPIGVADVQLPKFNPSETPPIAAPSPAKRPRHKPGERKELLLNAVHDVLTLNISMRKAASRYNLAKSSLCDFVRKNNIKLPNNRSRAPVSLPTVVGDAISPQMCSMDTSSPDLHLGGVKSDMGLDYPPSMRNLIASVVEYNGQQSQQLNAVRLSHSATPPVSLSNPIFSKMESPWHNVPGLPTQVPIQNWSHLPLSHVNLGKTHRSGHTTTAKLPMGSDGLSSSSQSFPSPICNPVVNSDDEQTPKVSCEFQISLMLNIHQGVS